MESDTVADNVREWPLADKIDLAREIAHQIRDECPDDLATDAAAFERYANYLRELVEE